MCKLCMWLSYTHAKHVLLWPQWFKHDVDLLTPVFSASCVLAMSLLFIRHAGSHKSPATSALSGSGMCGGSAAPAGQGNFFVRWELRRVRATQSHPLENMPNCIVKCLQNKMIWHVKPVSDLKMSRGCKKKERKASTEVVNGFSKQSFEGIKETKEWTTTPTNLLPENKYLSTVITAHWGDVLFVLTSNGFAAFCNDVKQRSTA